MQRLHKAVSADPAPPPAIGTRRVSNGWIDEWNGISWKAKGYNPALSNTADPSSAIMLPTMREIEREVTGEDRRKVEQWLSDHSKVNRAKTGLGGPMGPYLHEGFVTAARVDGDRLFATIYADVSRIDPSADPFGDAVRAAQEQTREDEIIPHPVSRPQTKAEIDALWESIMDVGRGA